MSSGLIGHAEGGVRDLIGALAAGVEAAATTDERVAALYRSDHAALVRFARSRTRQAEPEDVVQEAFGRLVREASRTGWPERPSAWLRRVIANLAVTEWRHARVVERTPPAEPDGVDPPDVIVLRHEASTALGVALGTLAPDGRLAVVMAAGGYSDREIAARLGRSELAARALLCRSRARLRLQLADHPAARLQGVDKGA
jgi:RNA polymerase sigma factor (sigma-70 family)